jgi:CRP-like cAMP-binding protein
MIKETFSDLLEKIAFEVDKNMLSEMGNRFKSKYFQKGEIITRAGEIENKIYIISEGVARSFYTKNDNEYSHRFGFKGDLLSIFNSFLLRIPADDSIEAITELNTFYITHEDFTYIIEHHPKASSDLRIKILEYLYYQRHLEQKQLISSTASERYLDLLENKKMYIEEIPIKYLASFLGVTPESLSRIRKKILK